MVGVKVRVGVWVIVADGVIDAVGVAVGELRALNVAQPEIMERVSSKQSSTTAVLK